MKFILNHNGFTAVNLAFVRSISVENVIYRDSDAKEVHVTAELENDSDVVLKIFDSDDEEKNGKAAEKYLAELVEILNEGGGA